MMQTKVKPDAQALRRAWNEIETAARDVREAASATGAYQNLTSRKALLAALEREAAARERYDALLGAFEPA